jgi:hypothetical protein
MGAAFLPGCGKAPSVPVALAPPGPVDLGPASGLSTPPADAVVFDLKYRPQTGAADDILSYSFWSFGGGSGAAKDSPFLSDVRAKASRITVVENPRFCGREWAAVEYTSKQAAALYFDLDANGKLSDNERIAPTRRVDQRVDFITPDFMNTEGTNNPVLCRALLRADLYAGSSEPNTMWSPAATLDGTATLNGKSARLLLFANSPGGRFDTFGSSSWSLLQGGAAESPPTQYFQRETLSSLILSDGNFYHLKIEGLRTNGLPARALLVRDTSPVGELAVKLAGPNTLTARPNNLSLHGVDDKTVFLQAPGGKDKLSLPEGAYQVNSGAIAYGASNALTWEVAFSKGPSATVKAGQVVEVALGQPTVKVRAVEERQRYDRGAASSSRFKKGTRIYLEPTVLGANQEMFTRFSLSAAGNRQRVDRPPRVTITGPDGKQVLSSTMEYG